MPFAANLAARRLPPARQADPELSKNLEVGFLAPWYFLAITNWLAMIAVSIAAGSAFQVSKPRRRLMNTSKCPVCDWDINEGGIKITVAGKEITVCCDDCVKQAQENPAKYAEASA